MSKLGLVGYHSAQLLLPYLFTYGKRNHTFPTCALVDHLVSISFRNVPSPEGLFNIADTQRNNKINGEDVGHVQDSQVPVSIISAMTDQQPRMENS